jgi:hypothetical protein
MKVAATWARRKSCHCAEIDEIEAFNLDGKSVDSPKTPSVIQMKLFCFPALKLSFGYVTITRMNETFTRFFSIHPCSSPADTGEYPFILFFSTHFF